MTQKNKNRSDRRRGIYILPNIFTTLSLFFGFYSILASVGGRFYHAAIYILASAVCDGLDGTVARMTNTTSQFGVEYDSLCDLVSFGAAPAIMGYYWALTPDSLAALTPYHKLGAAVSFVFLACGALRLARFNVFSGVRDPGFFQGLPIPGGAGVMAAAVLWHYRHQGLILVPNGPAIMALVLVLAFLMVSSLDYVSHKNKLVFRNQRPFETLVVMVFILGFVVFKINSALLPLGFLYLASGPVITMVRAGRRRRLGQEGTAETPAGAGETEKRAPT
ncbi:MAG: CDP-diacylglycerol--serine O-phosphatidyltransferase [Candidatus Adiutrix sp.]|jgi:CDP-diacylglycerol--serine O-phosphatidyltransferase|nr:CDP-diacylglycerol--serine O-phosphatidyltransferase [Candidatus Adiutrix sp.]